jgi:hypothetical protein
MNIRRWSNAQSSRQLSGMVGMWGLARLEAGGGAAGVGVGVDERNVLDWSLGIRGAITANSTPCGA